MSAALKKWADQVFGAVVLPEPSEAETFARIDQIDEMCPPDRTTILRLIEVFEDAGSVLMPYSDESLDRGFWDLGGCALGALKDEEIEWPLRRRLIRSFEILFREIFAVRCQPVLGHRSEEGSPLNSACYMWWDFNAWLEICDPLAQQAMHPEFLATILGCMRSILEIDHVACQESALHGLGHWHWADSAAVEAIVDEFLKGGSDLPGALKDYARLARSGRVL